MNVQQAMALAIDKLMEVGSERNSARIDGEYLLSKSLDKNFTWLKTWPEFELTAQQSASFLTMVQRRQRGEPVAYITGERAFWTLDLNTNESTLIPRPETELLVETALKFLLDKQPGCVLDLGTGTGAVALSIASERPDYRVYGCDYNQQAVELAAENALKNNIANVEIFHSDWFSKVQFNQFDLIVSNPPYVAANDPHLLQGDLVFEPNSALVSADGGFADIKLIIGQAPHYLNRSGMLMLEHGFEQAETVQQIFRENHYHNIRTLQDIAGLDRITLANV